MSLKKSSQLGMNPSTASHRLIKDLLWDFVVKSGMDNCYKCGGKMCRNTFSVEHKEAWLDSDDPVGLYFSVDNIAYSHLSCNVSTGRRNKVHDTKDGYKRAWDKKRVYDPVKRAEQYRRTGK